MDGFSDHRKKDVPSEFRVRARFYAIRQVDGERAYDWYKRVRAAAEPCGFGAVRQPQWTPVADKFVTGLRPGPVADRLLGERADGRLDYLLAAAIEAEEAAAAADGATRRRRIAGGETSGRRLPAGGTAPDLLSEIREGLKLYRYSSSGEGYDDRSIVRDGGGGGDDPRINDNKHKLSQISNVKMIGNMKSMVDGKSCLKKNDYTPLTCKNCCELATRLLENLEEKTRLYHQQSTINTYPEKPFSDSKSTSYYHDDLNCYCSLPTNNDRRIKNVAAIAVGKSNNTVSISNCLECTKSSKCCVCSVSDYS